MLLLKIKAIKKKYKSYVNKELKPKKKKNQPSLSVRGNSDSKSKKKIRKLKLN